MNKYVQMLGANDQTSNYSDIPSPTTYAKSRPQIQIVLAREGQGVPSACHQRSAALKST